ncbi:hypothetical protein [Aliidiomarina soli]|uniref:Uncharacterized protein n=1 Tax=Aliidiomarina soli TaxID=1928574 RepID=A0A432WGY2_9GAMM|nr:hypothetical protein [Aliidiomarina soli]RUO32949.1 hypothetical protein CWE14_06790 [Aliidiomarina soli]
MITLTKSKQQLMRGMGMTIIVVAALAFFILSDYRETGTLEGFGWIGLAAILAGLVAIVQQYYYFNREPKVIQLDLDSRHVINADTGKVLADFDKVTFFALSANKTNALIECFKGDKMVMRLKRHYQLNLRIADILAKHSNVEGVELKHIGLTR